MPRTGSPENPISPLDVLELEEELLLDEPLVDEDELLLDELEEDELLEELEDDVSSPPPHAASIALNIPMINILRIIVIAPHVAPAVQITNMDGCCGRFHHEFYGNLRKPTVTGFAATAPYSHFST